jgi:hypothetical protein
MPLWTAGRARVLSWRMRHLPVEDGFPACPMDHNPYRPPGSGAFPGRHASTGWPAILALVAGIAGWLVLDVLCGLGLSLQGQWWPGALCTAATFGAAALVVGWHCRGRVMLRWLLMVAGALIAVLGLELMPAVGLPTGSAAKNGSFLVALIVSWFALAFAGVLKSMRSISPSAREGEVRRR